MANLNSNISPSPIVAVRSKAGQTQTAATNSVTVSLSENPTGATLSGTLTKSAVAGLATFTDLQLNRSGAGFKLQMTASGIRQATSAAFNIPTKCVFTTQPVSADSGATLDPIVVTVRDNAGNTDANYNGDVTLSLFAGAATGILNGLTTRTASSGVVTFSGLSINEVGTYSVLATAAEVSTAYKPSSVVSNSFLISSGFVLTISVNTPTYDVYSSFVSAYGTPPANAVVTLIINSGVTVNALTFGSSWTGTPSFSWINLGSVLANGGAGGVGGTSNAGGGGDGNPGADAVDLNGQTVSIINASGSIWGGGGGGGGGEAGGSPSDGYVTGGGGGGGAGTSPGNAGGAPAMPDFGQGQGSNGTTTAGGVGGVGGSYAGPPSPLPSGGAGGTGGAPGEAGGDGVAATYGNGPGTGGAAGKAISLSGGAANFVSGSGSPNVKGAVS